MIAYIHNTTVVVADQERALDFYVNTLGWEKRIDVVMGDDYRFLTVAPVGGQTELALGPSHIFTAEPGTGVGAGPGMPGQTGITLGVDDVEETYRTLVERGVRFSGPLEEMPWGDKATWLFDPDGNGFFFTGR
jgi:catechol 2,3-dioxygenase-like lactoylglutathione lyase family enzyme